MTGNDRETPPTLCAECAQYLGTDDGPPPHDHAFEVALGYARAEGASDGKAAASWCFDGNTSDATYARVLRGIEDGDPEVLDTFPAPDLSGQYADTRTGPALVADAIWSARMTHVDGSTDPNPSGHAPGACAVCDTWDATGDIVDAYEMAFSDAVGWEIERVARYHVSDD